MARSVGVSGLGVTVAGAGAYLLYASVRDVPLLDGARQLLRGETPTPRHGAGAGTGSWLDTLGPPAGGSSSGLGAGAGGGSGTDASAAGGGAVADAVAHYLGQPYNWAHTFERPGIGGDCSGLVFRGFADVGIRVPRTSGQLAVWTQFARVTAAAPGDVLWWPGHVAVAVGGGQMIEAPTWGIPVRRVPIRRQSGRAPLILRYKGWA